MNVSNQLALCCVNAAPVSCAVLAPPNRKREITNSEIIIYAFHIKCLCLPYIFKDITYIYF